jgi:hypothetical protein
MAVLLTVAIALGDTAARAQDSMPPMPDTTYGAQDPGALQSPQDVGGSPPDLGPAPDSVTIPIPGGGQVSVDGPDAPVEQNIPTTPGGQWGEQQQQPASQDVGPNGP